MQKCVASTPASVNLLELAHEIMAEYRGGLISYAEKMLGDRHLAEDVVQETMIRAWRHIELLRSTEASIRGWLFFVTRNLVIDWTRKSYVRYEMVGATYTHPSEPDLTDAVLDTLVTKPLLRQLPSEHRAVLIHIYLCGRTVQETAGILGVPAGTVKSRHYYALRKLRSQAESTGIHRTPCLKSKSGCPNVLLGGMARVRV